MKPLLVAILIVFIFAAAFTQPLMHAQAQPSPLPTPLSSPLPTPNPSAPSDATSNPPISPWIWIAAGLLLGGAIILFVQRSSNGR